MANDGSIPDNLRATPSDLRTAMAWIPNRDRVLELQAKVHLGMATRSEAYELLHCEMLSHALHDVVDLCDLYIARMDADGVISDDEQVALGTVDPQSEWPVDV